MKSKLTETLPELLQQVQRPGSFYSTGTIDIHPPRHEVLPIASGHRLALIYNLVRVGRGDLPQPPDYASEQAQVVKLLRDWGNAKQASDMRQDPLKLIYPLEHTYSQAALGFDALKGADTAVAGLLSSAAESAGCDLHLALVTVEESGVRGRGQPG